MKRPFPRKGWRQAGMRLRKAGSRPSERASGYGRSCHPTLALLPSVKQVAGDACLGRKVGAEQKAPGMQRFHDASEGLIESRRGQPSLLR